MIEISKFVIILSPHASVEFAFLIKPIFFFTFKTLLFPKEECFCFSFFKTFTEKDNSIRMRVHENKMKMEEEALASKRVFDFKNVSILFYVIF